MHIGSVLLDDQTSYFIFGWQDKWSFWYKSTVQYSDELNDVLATKISKQYYQCITFGRRDRNITEQWVNNMFFGLLTMKIDP